MKKITDSKEENGSRRVVTATWDDDWVIISEKTKTKLDHRFQDDRIMLTLSEIRKIYKEYCDSTVTA